MKGKKGGKKPMLISGNPKVVEEALSPKKRGGRVGRAAGGKVLSITGGNVRPRLDRPGRKLGGRAGADKSPLSSAHTGSTSPGATASPKDTYGGLKSG